MSEAALAYRERKLAAYKPPGGRNQTSRYGRLLAATRDEGIATRKVVAAEGKDIRAAVTTALAPVVAVLGAGGEDDTRSSEELRTAATAQGAVLRARATAKAKVEKAAAKAAAKANAVPKAVAKAEPPAKPKAVAKAEPPAKRKGAPKAAATAAPSTAASSTGPNAAAPAAKRRKASDAPPPAPAPSAWENLGSAGKADLILNAVKEKPQERKVLAARVKELMVRDDVPATSGDLKTKLRRLCAKSASAAEELRKNFVQVAGDLGTAEGGGAAVANAAGPPPVVPAVEDTPAASVVAPATSATPAASVTPASVAPADDSSSSSSSSSDDDSSAVAKTPAVKAAPGPSVAGPAVEAAPGPSAAAQAAPPPPATSAPATSAAAPAASVVAPAAAPAASAAPATSAAPVCTGGTAVANTAGPDAFRVGDRVTSIIAATEDVPAWGSGVIKEIKRRNSRSVVANILVQHDKGHYTSFWQRIWRWRPLQSRKHLR